MELIFIFKNYKQLCTLKLFLKTSNIILCCTIDIHK